MEKKSGSLEDGAAAEANGGGSVPVVVQPTYKQLPDDDVNWQAKNSGDKEEQQPPEPTMGKQNGSTEPELDDGAEERMLKNDTKLTIVPSKDASEVRKTERA